MSAATIEQASANLLSGFSRLETVTSTIRSAMLNEHRRIEENLRVSTANGRGDLRISGHSMSYRNIDTGAPVFYDFTERGFDEVREDLISYRNKQYQWVLVEAFELFETFTSTAYAACKTWLPVENIPKDERGLSAKLNALRQTCPRLVMRETRNARNMNYRSAIALIELFRHIIVHRGGWIQNEARFIGKLRSLVQKNNSGAADQIIEKDSRFFLYPGSHGIEVYLLERPDRGSDHVFTDRLDTLLGWLLSYSDCLKTELVLKSS